MLASQRSELLGPHAEVKRGPGSTIERELTGVCMLLGKLHDCCCPQSGLGPAADVLSRASKLEMSLDGHAGGMHAVE